MDSNRDFKIITRHDRRILKDMLPLKKPLSVFIEPTNLCNFRCSPCVHGNEKTRNDLKPFKHMELDLFRKIISEIKGWEGGKLRLLRLAVLGEPFLHPRFTTMIKIAKDANVADRVDTFSNGSLLTEDVSSRIVDYGLDHIRFSIYSVDPERHREVTRSNCDIHAINDNIRKLRSIRDARKASKPFILVKMFDAFTAENDIFLNMYHDIADEVAFEKVHNATRYRGHDLVQAYYKNDALAAMTKADYRKGLHAHVACPRPFLALVISSMGDVLMCTHDAPRATKVGDVKDNTLEEIWNGRILFEFRKMHLMGNKHENLLCRNCDWYKLFPIEDNVDGFPIEKLMPEGVDWHDSLHKT